MTKVSNTEIDAARKAVYPLFSIPEITWTEIIIAILEAAAIARGETLDG